MAVVPPTPDDAEWVAALNDVHAPTSRLELVGTFGMDDSVWRVDRQERACVWVWLHPESNLVEVKWLLPRSMELATAKRLLADAFAEAERRIPEVDTWGFVGSITSEAGGERAAATWAKVLEREGYELEVEKIGTHHVCTCPFSDFLEASRAWRSA